MGCIGVICVVIGILLRWGKVGFVGGIGGIWNFRILIGINFFFCGCLISFGNFGKGVVCEGYGNWCGKIWGGFLVVGGRIGGGRFGFGREEFVGYRGILVGGMVIIFGRGNINFWLCGWVFVYCWLGNVVRNCLDEDIVLGNVFILFFFWILVGCVGGGGGYDGLLVKVFMVGGIEVVGEIEFGGMVECGIKDEVFWRGGLNGRYLLDGVDDIGGFCNIGGVLGRDGVVLLEDAVGRGGLYGMGWIGCWFGGGGFGWFE